MKAYKLTLLLMVTTALWPQELYTQVITDYRFTRRGSRVEVQRMLNLSGRDLDRLRSQERRLRNRFPESRLLVSAVDYMYLRNCHDYAWAPFMSCMCIGPQPEAWWMNDPRANWLDGSMVQRATGVKMVREYWDVWRRDEVRGYEYAFRPDEIDPLQFLYYNPLGELIPLPVTNVGDVGAITSGHSTLLDGVTTSVLAIDENNQLVTFYLCRFRSKWGALGIWRHRWGTPFCPPLYCASGTVRLFAPGAGWGSAPPYFVYPTAW